ncbi:MAG: DMT family transporter [Proteobacteria bacterium]|nr:DMT family transporter [Pseudomonadota bacterium]
MDQRKPLDANAFSLMLVLTALWGFQQVAIKLTAPDVSLVMQAGLRTALATALLLAWARWRGIALFSRDGTLAAGLVAGLLFGGEFVFIYAGLAHTAASRMVVFIYLAPIVTAIGLHAFVPGERLVRGQWAGVLLAFAGVALAFGDGFLAARGATLLGDLFGLIAALLWGATTVLIRASGLARASAAKTLFYQLAVSAPMLLATSLLLGEKGVVALTPLAVASLAYQGILVAFASYLAWFWLLTRYLAARLAVFSFLTPLFGVLFGVAILGEPLTPTFAGAALLVGAGIVLVNRR